MRGNPVLARYGNASRRSFSETFSNSATPDGVRKHLNALTPASASGMIWSALPGTTPPMYSTFTCDLPWADARFASSASTEVVAGIELRGMSRTVSYTHLRAHETPE